MHTIPQSVHRRMLLEPHRWPHRPLLCLKRGPWESLECGVLVENTLTVYQWAFTSLSPWAPVLDPTTTRYSYPDLDALLASGWEVD